MIYRKMGVLFLSLWIFSCSFYGENTTENKKNVVEQKIVPEKPKVITSLLDFAQKVEADIFNPSDKKTEPKEGGRIRLRVPVDVRILNPILSSEATANQIMNYIYDSLIIRDPETFEWLPWLAYAWEVKDSAILGGKEVFGYYDNEKKIFYPGQGLVRALHSDIKPLGNNIYRIQEKTFYGRIKKIIHTSHIFPEQNGIAIPEKNIKKSVVFIFYIRKGITWHDGFTFDADDVVFSYQIINNPYTDAAHLRNYYKDIRKVEKIDNYTVSFTYEKPYFLSLSFCGGMPILPKHRYNPENFKGNEKALADYFNSHPDNRKPIGTGPYIFKEWKTGQRITLEKNKEYWARKVGFPYFSPKQPYLDQIQFVIINNNNAALKELLAENIDADFEVEQSLWFDPRTESDFFKQKLVKAKFLTPVYTYIGWNNEKVWFKDPKVRRALAHLIPKEKILKGMHHNLGQIVTGPFFVNGPVYDKSLPILEYNPIKARELLREAGWIDHDGDGIRDKDGVKFEFEYLIHNAKEYHQKVADIIKESLEEAGIIMHIRVIDWTIFAKTVSERNFDAVRFAWGTSIDGDEYQIWHSSQIGGGGSNFVGYRNKEVDDILEKARMEFDTVKRWSLYRRMHHILYEEQPYCFLFSLDTLGFYNKKLRGVKFYSTGYNLNEWYME